MASKKLGAPTGTINGAATGVVNGAQVGGYVVTSTPEQAAQVAQAMQTSNVSEPGEQMDGQVDENTITPEELREKEVAYKHNMIDVQNGIDTDVLNTGSLAEKKEFTEKVMESSLYGKQLAQANGTPYDVPDMFPDVNGNMTVGIQSYEPVANTMTMTKGSENFFSNMTKQSDDVKLSHDERVLANTMQNTTSKQLDGFTAKESNENTFAVHKTLNKSAKTLESTVGGAVSGVGKALAKNPAAKGAAIGMAAGSVVPVFGTAMGGVVGAGIGAVSPMISNVAKSVTSRVSQNQNNTVSNNSKASRIAQAEALSSGVETTSNEKDDSLGMV